MVAVEYREQHNTGIYTDKLLVRPRDQYGNECCVKLFLRSREDCY